MGGWGDFSRELDVISVHKKTNWGKGGPLEVFLTRPPHRLWGHGQKSKTQERFLWGENIVDFGISLVALCQEWRPGCSLWGIQWTFGLQQYSFLFDVTSCQFLLSTPKKGHSESHCNSCISPPKMASLLIIGSFMRSHCVTECADYFTTATVSFSATSQFKDQQWSLTIRLAGLIPSTMYVWNYMLKMV